TDPSGLRSEECGTLYNCGSKGTITFNNTKEIEYRHDSGAKLARTHHVDSNRGRSIAPTKRWVSNKGNNSGSSVLLSNRNNRPAKPPAPAPKKPDYSTSIFADQIFYGAISSVVHASSLFGWPFDADCRGDGGPGTP
ncbi:hypothetical protein, partial [Streptomyces sp. SID12501]|uniref:hypothetical protein n=1 Tax=Streptomyces sp. SID12501 TaxID=2706042 RepID=UPI001943ECA0